MGKVKGVKKAIEKRLKIGQECEKNNQATNPSPVAKFKNKKL